MTLNSLTLLLALMCLALVAATLVARLLVPVVLRFVALSSGPDSLQNRVFPLVAFLGLISILIRLTVF